MNRFAWPGGIVAFAVILAGCSQATSPTVTVTVTSPAGSSSSAPSPTATTTPPAPPPPVASATVCISPTVAVGCASEMRVQPRLILLSGDSSTFIRRLTWSAWGTSTANGTGTLEIDNCNPNCAQGSLTGYHATVTLTGLTPYGSGQQGYADMTVSAPGSPYGTRHFAHLLP